MGRVGRSAVGVILSAVATVGGIGATAAPASAWYGPFVFTAPSTVKPGSSVQVHGVYFAKSDPVEARLGAIDGRVLATFTPESGSKGREFRGAIPVPDDTPAGVHMLVFTQFDARRQSAQMPLRAMVTVTDPSGAVPVLAQPVGRDTTSRPAMLTHADDDGLGVRDLVLIGFGAAGVAMFLAGIAAVAASRSPKARTTAAAR